MGYQTDDIVVAARIESTPGTDPMGGSPTGTDFLKVSDLEYQITTEGLEDDGASGHPAGWVNVPGSNTYSIRGFVDLPCTALANSSARPRGWQILAACGFQTTYAAGPPKTLTTKLTPGDTQSLTFYVYRRDKPSQGSSASNWLDKLQGVRLSGTLTIRNGILGIAFEGMGKTGSRSNGATMPTEAPFIDTASAYRHPLAWTRGVTVSLQDSAGNNVASTLLQDFSLDLGQQIEPLPVAASTGDPVAISRLHTRAQGTMRLKAITRATSDPLAVLQGRLGYVVTLTLTDPADADLTTIVAVTLTPNAVTQTEDRGEIVWDVPFRAAFPSDGTAIGRTPAALVSITWSDAN